MDWLVPAIIIAAAIIVAALVVSASRPRDLLKTVANLSAQVRELSEQVQEYSRTMREMEADAAADRGEIRQLETRIYDAVRLISQLVDGHRQLVEQITNDGGIPVYEIPTDAKLLLELPPKEKYRSVELRFSQQFGESFNDDELRGVCLQLGTAVGTSLDYENLPGSIRQSKAQSLVRWATNRDVLAELAEIGQQERPKLDWSL